MKRLFPVTWLVLALAAAPLATRAAPDKTAGAVLSQRYIPSDATDWKAVLPPPPAAGSVAALADLETVLQVQASRTPADVAWAQLIAKDDIFADYGDVVGPWFTAEKLPELAHFLREVTGDAKAVNDKIKHVYARPRPPAVEPTVQPCVEIPKSYSYPSGHALRAYVWAAVLGDVFPDLQPELFARAHRIAWGRVIGGVHFPSDTVAGRLMAQAIVAELRKNPAYHAAVGKCQAEVAPFLIKKAA